MVNDVVLKLIKTLFTIIHEKQKIKQNGLHFNHKEHIIKRNGGTKKGACHQKIKRKLY